MTTTSLLDERTAVQITATLDPSNPDYREAVEVALARRGSRDALISTLSRDGNWAKVLEVFHDLRSNSTTVNENVDSVYATAHAVAGSSAIAAAVCRLHPDHRMLGLLGRIIENGTPVEVWLERMAALDVDVCYAFGD